MSHDVTDMSLDVVAEFGSMGSRRRLRRRGRGRVGRSLTCPQGRLRLLRAAWRPCSRGPALRAVMVAKVSPSAAQGSFTGAGRRAGQSSPL